MRQVAHIMGIPISIDIPGVENGDVFKLAFERLRAIDATFSTYKDNSEVSRYRKGKLRDDQLSRELKQVEQACVEFEQKTDGYFSAYYNGSFDPTGYVKGWAIREAGDILEKHGHNTYLINAAGDILASSKGEKTWQVGLQNPFEPGGSMGTIGLKNGAIATSGTYERGQHILDPHTKQAATAIVSVTIYGPDIITADVFATACTAMNPQQAVDFINQQADYEALVVDPQGHVLTSQSFAAA